MVRWMKAVSYIPALSIGSSRETGKRERALAMWLCFPACYLKRTLAPTTFCLSLCSWLLMHSEWPLQEPDQRLVVRDEREGSGGAQHKRSIFNGKDHSERLLLHRGVSLLRWAEAPGAADEPGGTVGATLNEGQQQWRR